MNLKFYLKNFFNLIFTGTLFRISIFLSTFLLISFIDPFNYGKWQLIKSILGATIILFEFGFFYSFNNLVNIFNYNFKSVLFSVYKFRLFLNLLILPILIIYLAINNFDFASISIIILLFFLLIFDYDLALDVIKKNNLVNLVRLLKFSIFCSLIFHYKNSLTINNILIFFIISHIFSIIFQYISFTNFKDKNKKIFSFSIQAIIKKNINFFLIRFFSQFIIVSSIIISPFFLTYDEIAYAGILIALGELILLPTYQVQRFLLPRLLKNNIKQFFYPIALSSIIILIGFFMFIFIGIDLMYLILKDKYNINFLFNLSKLMFFYAVIMNINVHINLILYNVNKYVILKNITVFVGIISLPIHIFFIHSLSIFGLVISIIILQILFFIFSLYFLLKKNLIKIK